MKRLLISSLVALLGFALTGCASTRTAGDATETRQASQRSEIDYRYVNRVNRQAQRQGTRVQWVNPPRRVQTPSLEFNITTSEPESERDPK